MKKFITFFVAALVVFAASASAQRARVILNSNTNYEVQVDGRNYNNRGTSTIDDLNSGRHSVAVYQVISRGIFGIGKKRNLLSSEQFNLRNNDVYIAVNQNGQVRISENGYDGYSKSRRGNDDYSHGRYGNSEGKGRGHKYGHYKNKNDKYYKGNSRHREDDDDDDDYRNDRRGDND